MQKTINKGGYEITIRKTPHNGMFELSTMAYSMGDEYRVHKMYDVFDDDVVENFINYVESTK